MQNTLQSNKMLADASRRVKAQFIRHGVILGELSRAANVHLTTLSQHIHGLRRSYKTQLAIYEAYCRIVGRKPTHNGMGRFWGPLLGRDMG